jgi:hypothetical protein
MRKLPDYCQKTQGGGADVVFVFPLEKLDEIADIVKAKKRRQVSEEIKRRLREFNKLHGFKKHIAGTGIAAQYKS